MVFFPPPTRRREHSHTVPAVSGYRAVVFPIANLGVGWRLRSPGRGIDTQIRLAPHPRMVRSPRCGRRSPVSI